MMPRLFKRLTTAPDSSEFDRLSEPRATEHTLTLLLGMVIVLAAMMLATLLIASQWRDIPRLSFFVSTILSIIVGAGVLILLNRGGYTRAAAHLFIVGMSVVITLMALHTSGPVSIAMTGYFLLIVAAGLVLGRWAVIWTAGLSIAEMLLSTAITYQRGLIPPGALLYWGLYVGGLIITLILTSAVLYLAFYNMRLAIANSEHELAERKRAEQAEREQREMAEALRDTVIALNSSLRLDEVLDRVLDNLERVIHFDGADILLVRDSSVQVAGSRGYEGRSTYPRDARYFDVFELPTFATIYRTQQPLTIPDANEYPGWKSLLGSEWINSFAGVPILLEDRVIGFLNLVSRQPNAFTQEHTERLQAFASQAAVAIQNARLYEELTNYSSILEQAVSEATAELVQAMERVQAILDNSPDAILLVTRDGRIEAINPAFSRIFGYSRRAAHKLSPDELAVEEDAERFKTAIQAALNAADTARVEFTARRQNGETFDADAALASIPSLEGTSGFVCSVRDISMMKDVERMKDSFISTAAHELRTPLTSILGFSEILLTRSVGETRRERYITTIYRQSAQLAQIIDEMLDISRLEAGRGLKMHLEPVDLVELLDDVIQPFTGASTRHSFELKLEPDLPVVPGDPFRLAQVVRNLVSNAVKYSPEGGPIRIEAHTEKDVVRISVEDKGMGIRPEQLEHIFEKFYRIEAPNTAIPGTGLGLSISELIVKAHGGEITVESEPGKGSIFAFTLPLISSVPAEQT